MPRQEIRNDRPARAESMVLLVHVTCCRGYTGNATHSSSQAGVQHRPARRRLTIMPIVFFSRAGGSPRPITPASGWWRQWVRKAQTQLELQLQLRHCSLGHCV